MHLELEVNLLVRNVIGREIEREKVQMKPPLFAKGLRAYDRYMGSAARAEWPTFLPSKLQNLLTYEIVIYFELSVKICNTF